jgi:hypothetical protein
VKATNTNPIDCGQRAVLIISHDVDRTCPSRRPVRELCRICLISSLETSVASILAKHLYRQARLLFSFRQAQPSPAIPLPLSDRQACTSSHHRHTSCLSMTHTIVFSLYRLPSSFISESGPAPHYPAAACKKSLPARPVPPQSTTIIDLQTNPFSFYHGLSLLATISARL